MPLAANATHRLISSAASVNATLIQANSACLRGIVGYNANAAARWLKLYDQATVPSEADTPRKTIYLPPTSAFALDMADYFAFGLGFRLTTAGADADTGAVSAGDILGLNLDYR